MSSKCVGWHLIAKGRWIPGEEGGVEPPQKSKVEGEAVRGLNYSWFEMTSLEGDWGGKRSWTEGKKRLNAFPAPEGKAGG